MTTPLDPYGSATSSLPSAVQSIIPGNAIGANSQTINTAEMNLSSSGGGAILGYSGTPTNGNLTFSLSSASGTDTFGNSVATGLVVGSGSITGVSLTGIQMDSTSTLQGTQINQPQVLNPTVAGGTAASLVHTMTNTGGNVLGYVSSTASTTFATNGNYLWTAPTGVTSVRIQCWGAGGGGGGGNAANGGESGAGGEYAEEPNFTVVPGNVYAVIVGQGGYGGSTGQSGQDGTQTVFQSQSGGGSNVTANPGTAGLGVGGAGGSGSTNTIHFDGGDGADQSGNTGGAGGGGSGSYSGQGNTGNQSTSSSGAAGASAITGGGGGGAGGNAASNGVAGGGPGGGGGGAGADSLIVSSKTYTPSGGTYSYRGSDANTSPNALLNHDGPLYQGFPNAAYGTQYSYWILPWAQIQSDMSGLNITSVSMRIKCLYSYYSGGVYAHVYYTSLSSFGNTGNRTGGSPVFVSNFLIKENQTLTQSFGLNGSIGTALQSGAAKSIQFSSIPLTPAGDYYGSFDSGANNGVVPELIVYYNNGGGVTAYPGADGQVIISYQSGTIPTFQLSVSSSASADVFGNPFNPGFTGSQFTILGSQAPATTPTTISNTNATSTAVAANTAGQIIATNAQGFTGTMSPVMIGSIGKTTVASSTNYSTIASFNIPGGDPQIGTIYRMTAWGDLVIAAEQTLTWTTFAWGNSIASCQWGGAPLTTATYEWYITGMLQFTNVGSGGLVNSWLSGSLGWFITSGNLGNVNSGGALIGASSGNAVNTTSNNTVQMQMKFGGTGITMHAYGSSLERLGP